MIKSRLKVFFIIKIGVIIAVIWLLYVIACFFIRLDFSQDYHEIPGIENIIFQRNGRSEQYYKRCFWGLSRTEVPERFENYSADTSALVISELLNIIDVNHYIRQAVFSPDKNYILYCEIEAHYKKIGVTDDEYCYYKVCEVKSGEIITIYHTYREWYNLDWLE